jgi:CxxC motif-containing protein
MAVVIVLGVGRIVMYRESRSFTVTKKELQFPCKYKTVAKSKVNAPVKSGDNVWRMQLRGPRARRVPV